MKKREIGSNFYLSSGELAALSVFPVEKPTPAVDAADERYLSSGRQGIRFCLRDLQQDSEWEQQSRVALLPEYTCASVIQPFLQENYRVYFYSVQQNLEVSFNKLNQLVLFHYILIL